jgi:hypothetical protein
VCKINLGKICKLSGLFARFVDGVETLGFFAVGGVEAVPFLRNGVEE